MEVELDRLRRELSRAESRRSTLQAEYNRKWSRLRYQLRRIAEIQAKIRVAEEKARRARKKTKRARREALDELADIRASITPYMARRDEIIADITYERDVLLRPLQSRIRTLKRNIREVEDELERRVPPPPPPPPPPVGYVEREYTAYLELPARLARPGSPPARFEARGVFTIPADLDPEDDRVRSAIQELLISAIEEVGKTRTMVHPETLEVVTVTFEPSVIDRNNFPIQGLTVGFEDLGTTDRFRENVDVDVVKIQDDEVTNRWRTRVHVTEDELRG